MISQLTHTIGIFVSFPSCLQRDNILLIMKTKHSFTTDLLYSALPLTPLIYLQQLCYFYFLLLIYGLCISCRGGVEWQVQGAVPGEAGQDTSGSNCVILPLLFQ